MKRFHFRSSTLSLALFLLSMVVFLPLAPFLGLYWDDWPSLWFLHHAGPTIFPTAFSIDRPLQGYLWIITTSLAGESVLSWHIFGILGRLLAVLAFAWVLRLVWPRQTIQIATVLVLMLVYPGFLQQYIPMTYVHMFLNQAAFFVSVGLMLLAYRSPRPSLVLLAISWIISVASMFVLEYFVGLELLRPALLWLIAKPSAPGFRQRLKWLAQRWLPFLITLALFVAWRISNDTPRGDITIFDRLSAGTLPALFGLLQTALVDMYQASLGAWGLTLSFPALVSGNRTITLPASAIMISTGLVCAIYLARLETPTGQEPLDRSEQMHWAIHAIGLGLYTLFAAGWPFWATDLRVELFFPWDRFTLAFMPGVSLLLGGLIHLVARRQWQSALVVGIMASLAAGFLFWVGVLYRQDWTRQSDFLWQLSWRAPGLKPQTILLAPELRFAYVTDNSLSAPLNWMYAPENPALKMSYMLVDINARLNSSLASLEPGTPVDLPYRATSFTGTTSQAVVFYYDPPRCLKVIDPETDKFWPYRPKYLDEAMPLSRLELIDPLADPPARPPEQIFGSEPARDWCYYFQKADLARQTGDWEEIVRLGDKAFQLDKQFTQETIAEMLPFIEGYAMAGDWQRAIELTTKAYRMREKLAPALCLVWYKVNQSVSASDEKNSALQTIQAKLPCQLP